MHESHVCAWRTYWPRPAIVLGLCPPALAHGAVLARSVIRALAHRTPRVASLIPDCLELDLFEGSAYVAVVPFRMTDIHPHFVPPLPGTSAFPELNLRTYVRPKRGPADRGGVYFWSLEATNALAVATARRFFHLPYMNAEMSCEERDGWIHYSSRVPVEENLPPRSEDAIDRSSHAAESAARFLTERYCLYSVDAHGDAIFSRCITLNGRCLKRKQYRRKHHRTRRRHRSARCAAVIAFRRNRSTWRSGVYEKFEPASYSSSCCAASFVPRSNPRASSRRPSPCDSSRSRAAGAA